MKKQILLLTFFSMAILFAGMNSYGQVAKPYVIEPTGNPACLAPTPLQQANVTADELHPVQGETYDYTVLTTAGTDVVRWFVVNNTEMETAGDSLVSALSGVLAAGNAAIDDGTGTDDYIYSVVSGTYELGGAAASANSTIQLQWKYFDGIAEEILLVAYVESDPTCTNNMAVWRIIPEPAFTIDIASVMEDGTNPLGPLDATTNEECVSPIEMAWYNGQATTPADLLTVDYGENWAFFVVNGANYFDSWAPTFRITYDAGYNDLEASWTYLDEFTAGTHSWVNIASLDGTTQEATPIIAGGSGNNVGDNVVPAAAGECIVVRVRIDYDTGVEHDQANGTLNFAVTGTAWDGDGANLFDNSVGGTAGAGNFEDLHWDDCTADGFTNDNVDYLITPRPQVEEGSPIMEIKTGQGVN